MPQGISFENGGTSGSYRYVSGGVGGSRGIEVTTPGGYSNPAWLNLTATNGLQSAYVRFLVKKGRTHQAGLNFFVLLENGNSNMDGSSVRMRFFNNTDSIMWNVEGAGDAVVPNLYDPAQSDKSVRLNSGELACLELFYDNSNDLLRVWMNGNPVEGLTVDNNPSTGYDERLINNSGGFFNVNVRLVRLGWQGLDGNTMLFDNIAVSQTRIGCN